MVTWLLQYKEAAIKAAKTAVQTFVGVILAAWLGGGDMDFTALIDTIESQADFAAGSAVFAAASALGWNARSSRKAAKAEPETPNPYAPHGDPPQ